MEDEETFCECVAFKMLRLNLDYLINIHVISNMFIQSCRFSDCDGR